MEKQTIVFAMRRIVYVSVNFLCIIFDYDAIWNELPDMTICFF